MPSIAPSSSFQVLVIKDFGGEAKLYKPRKLHAKTKLGCLACRTKKVKVCISTVLLGISINDITEPIHSVMKTSQAAPDVYVTGAPVLTTKSPPLGQAPPMLSPPTNVSQ